MAQLIQLTHRIRAVDTIKKITHATRLVAMSAHTRLAHKEPLLTHYRTEVQRLLNHMLGGNQNAQESLFSIAPDSPRTLIFLVGSQKGLCGTFNVGLFKSFEYHFTQLQKNGDVIVIGKKAQEYVNRRTITPKEIFNNLTTATLPTITELVTQLMVKEAHNYKKIVFFSNQPQTFFSQKIVQTTILPLELLAQNTKNQELLSEEYIWEEPQEAILPTLAKLYLQVTIQSLLFSSLVAEQAARFQSMDSATRNAEDLLETMRRDYNKLRQAKITKELLELASSMSR